MLLVNLVFLYMSHRLLLLPLLTLLYPPFCIHCSLACPRGTVYARSLCSGGSIDSAVKRALLLSPVKLCVNYRYSKPNVFGVRSKRQPAFPCGAGIHLNFHAEQER